MTVFSRVQSRLSDGAKEWLPGLGMPLVAMMALSIAACSEGSQVLPPEVKINPAPKERYEITLQIETPPSEISIVTGSAQFDVKDKTCMPMTDPIAGVWKYARFVQSVTFHRERRKYVGTVYADQLLDEDYDGLGVCHWNLTGVSVRMRAGEVERIASIRSEQILRQQETRGLCRSDNVPIGVCLTPPDAVQFQQPHINFLSILKSRKVSP